MGVGGGMGTKWTTCETCSARAAQAESGFARITTAKSDADAWNAPIPLR